MNAHRPVRNALQRPAHRTLSLALVYALACAGIASLPHAAHAQTWNGGGPNSNWSAVGAGIFGLNNWSGVGLASLPHNGSSLTFDGTNRLTNTNDTLLIVSGLTFANGAGAFTLNGNALTVAGAITNNSTNLQTLNMAITAGTSSIWDGGTAGTTLNGGLTLSNNQVTLLRSITLNHSGAFDIGNGGSAALTIKGGSKVNAASAATLGRNLGDNGSVTVEGANSRWIVGTPSGSDIFDIGYQGSGTMTIQLGGYVSSRTSIIGSEFSGTGSVTVKNTGSVWDTGRLAVGNYGNGQLTIQDGAKVNSTAGGLANALAQGPSTGTVTVTGPSSEWNVGAELNLGFSGNATLNILNGALVTSGFALVSNAYTGNGTGIVTVDGVNSRWLINGDMKFGSQHGGGALTIRNGGTVSMDDLVSEGYGTVTLDNGNLVLRSMSNGTPLDWIRGTLHYTGNAHLDHGWDSTLVLTNGKKLIADGTLTVGAHALIASGGVLQANATTLAGGLLSGVNIADTGNLTGHGTMLGTISGGVGKTITASGGALTLGNVGANDSFVYAGTLDVGSLQVVLLSKNAARLGSTTRLATGGNLSAVNGLTLPTGSALVVDYSVFFFGDPVRVGNATILGNFTNNGHVSALGATLIFLNDVKGAGSFSGDVVFHAGYSPGNSPASIDFGGGNATYDSTSVLTMEILGPAAGTQYDQIVNINHLTFNGTLKLVFGNGYAPAPGSHFTLLGFQTFSGSLASDHIQVIGFDAAKLDISHLATNGTLSVAAVPEAQTWAMLLAGLGLLGIRAGRTHSRKRGASPFEMATHPFS